MPVTDGVRLFLPLLLVSAIIGGCAHPTITSSTEPEPVTRPAEVQQPVRPGSHEKSFEWQAPLSSSLALSPDGRFAVYSLETQVTRDANIYAVQEVRRLDLESGAEGVVDLDLPFSQSSAAAGLAVSPGGDALAASWHGHIGIVDLETGALRADIDRIYLGDGLARKPENPPVQHLAYAPNGDSLVGITSQEVLWWEPKSGEQVARAERKVVHPRLSISHEGRAAVAVAGALEVFEDGKSVTRCETEGDLSTFAISPDGSKLAAAFFNGPVRIWRIEGCALVAEWSPSTNVPRDGIGWLPESGHLAIGGGNGTITFLSAETGEAVATLDAHDASTPLFISADGRRIVTRGGRNEDGTYTIRSWNAP
jgi:WD40 repeat protein